MQSTSSGKKKKKHSKVTRAKMPYLAPSASGFEEFFADVPIRPEEAKEELETYANDVPIMDRIQIAITRFYGSRRLDAKPWFKAVFDAYLLFAALQSSTGNPQGPDADGEPLTSACAKDLDFEYCSQAFMSSKCETAAGQSTIERLRDAPLIVNNFLLYMMRHNVAPELKEQLEAAIRMGQAASMQMTRNKLLSMHIPDDLSIALSALSGGHYQSMQENSQWLPSFELPTFANERMATELVDKLLPGVSKLLPSGIIRRQAIMSVREIEGDQQHLSFLYLEPWTPPECDDSDHEEDDVIDSGGDMRVVLLHSSTEQYCYVGQKIEATFIHPTKLQDDWWFIESVTRTWPAYYIKC